MWPMTKKNEMLYSHSSLAGWMVSETDDEDAGNDDKMMMK